MLSRASAPVSISASLSAAPAAYYLHHFYAFVRRNDFTGKAAGAAVHDDLQHLAGLGAASYLRDAMMAVGALHAANMNVADVPSSLSAGSAMAAAATASCADPRRRAGLEYYATAVSGLSHALAASSASLTSSMDTRDPDTRDAVLWTTLFLGFYELMTDPRAAGWRLHMVHGTAKALQAGGAACCRSGRLRTFFLQARVFEVFRAIVFSDATFLMQPEWVQLLEGMWVDGRGGSSNNGADGVGDSRWHPLDALLDLVMLCTKLRYRIRGFLPHCDAMAPEEVHDRGYAIAAGAVSLRRALDRWHATHIGEDGLIMPHPSASSCSSSSSSSSSSMILGRIFHAATSAYLSGMFEYEIDQWQAIHIPVPTLSDDDLQPIVDTILQHAGTALATTNVSPVLMLFPLRVAGARARSPDQRAEVLRLLGQVGRMYAAATYYSDHLQRLWVRLAAEGRTTILTKCKPIEAG